jgi:hypothetical protein
MKIKTNQEQEILEIIRKEAEQIPFGVLSIALIIKAGRVMRIEASTTKKEYKI